jgi:ribosomal protein S18 acetylase RimI-like enzyme
LTAVPPVNVNERDLADLAALHQSCLPDSDVTGFGAAYVRSFYRYLTRSRREIVLVERNNAGRIVAAAVVSLDPHSLNRRLLVGTSLLPHLIRHVFRVVKLTLSPANGNVDEAQVPRTMPDLLLIYTSPDERGRGRASALIDQAETRLRALKVPEYQVRTVADPSNPALAFYRKRNFVLSGTVSKLGRRFQVFTRKLTP